MYKGEIHVVSNDTKPFLQGGFHWCHHCQIVRFLTDGEETHLRVSAVVQLRYSACNPLFYSLESLSVTVHI